jgi:hypothetical protein
VGIELGRGVFENPDDPLDQDLVGTSIVVVVAEHQRDAAQAAIERCIERWWGIDGAGRHHDRDDPFWDAWGDHTGVETHAATYVAHDVTPQGIEVYVDVRSLMPAPMRRAYRRVLVEELDAAGIRDGVVRSQHADDHGPAPDHDPSWPPHQEAEVLCLPPGVPPGEVLRQELHRHLGVANPMLPRPVAAGWEATAIAATPEPADAAVQRALDRFAAAGWHAGAPAARTDPDDKPFLVAQVTTDRGAGFVACQDVTHVHRRHVAAMPDAGHLLAVAAYYEDGRHASP